MACLFGLVLLIAALMPGFYDHAIERFEDVDREMTTDNAHTRETVWLYTRRMIANNPVMGIGFGEDRFVATIDAYGFRDKYEESPLDNPHNSYLQMTVYAGFPTLIVFILANVALLSRAGRLSLGDAAGEAAPTVFGIAVGICGFLVSAYPDMHLFTRDVGPVYWVFCGLLFSLAARDTKLLSAAVHPHPAPAARSLSPGLGRARFDPVAVMPSRRPIPRNPSTSNLSRL
jgi:hypothetical protein